MKEPGPENWETMSAELVRNVDQVCDRFEADWKAGRRPRAEDYLKERPEAEHPLLLRELLALDVEYRRRNGEQPTWEEYQRRFPGRDLAWLAAELGAAPQVVTPPQAASPPAANIQRLRCPHCHNPIQLLDERPDEVLCPGCGSTFRVRDARHTDTGSSPRPLGKFQLLERVGVGAFGAVWKARDTELHRIVALKIPHTGLLTADDELERFHREARAAAQLRHPGIVTVHEVVTLDGLPTIVSDFVEGVPLKDLIEVRRLTFRAAAELMAAVAEALEYAHTMGLVHRDLKPGRPLLLDFGLALRDEAEVTMTLDGHVIGTPAYMSPEQAAGKSHQADRRSDVYSLGVILYELLTGELPFRGSRLMILQQVLMEEPRPPRKVNDKVPRDLETICLKCLRKEPARRYAAARELAEDLQHFLKGEPIAARPVGRIERGWSWCRRNRAVAGLLAAVFVTLTAGTVVATYFAIEADGEATNALREKGDKEKALEAQIQATREANDAKQREQEKAKLAEDRLKEKTELFALSTLRLAQVAWERGEVDSAWELLDEVPEAYRGWEWRYLKRKYRGGYLTLYGHTGPVTSVAFSPDGRRLATASGDQTIKVWNAQSGQELFTIKGHTGSDYSVYSVTFSPDGQQLATASNDGTAKIWDALDGHELLTLKGHTGVVVGVTFSTDGQQLATASDDGTAKIWDAHTGKELLTLNSTALRWAF